MNTYIKRCQNWPNRVRAFTCALGFPAGGMELGMGSYY